MSERTPKKKRIRGFAGVIAKQLEPLNSNEKFKNRFKNVDKKLLINATDGRFAALITIDHGIVSVEGVPNKDKKALKKKVLGWDGKLATNTKILLDIAMGKLSTGGMIKKVITRKIKVKGARKLLLLNTMFEMLQSEKAEVAKQ